MEDGSTTGNEVARVEDDHTVQGETHIHSNITIGEPDEQSSWTQLRHLPIACLSQHRSQLCASPWLKCDERQIAP